MKIIALLITLAAGLNSAQAQANGPVDVFKKSTRIAIGLSSGGYSCQNEGITLQELLSETPRNDRAIRAAQLVYLKCVDLVADTVLNSIQSKPDIILQNLTKNRQVCENQSDKIADLLSQGRDQLDFPAIEKAKDAFIRCQKGALTIIQNPPVFE